MIMCISESLSTVHILLSYAAISMAVIFSMKYFFVSEFRTGLSSVPKKFFIVLALVTMGNPLLSNCSNVSISGS